MRRIVVAALAAALAVAACGAAAPSPAASPSPTPSPSPSPAAAANFTEYATAFCSAWGTMFRVVGNPETAAWTDTVRQLQAAAETRDAATAARLASQINAELAAARGQIAVARGWPPAARPMAEMDRFFAAEEVWITAYANVAAGVPNAPDPQTALEAAGGIDAWMAWLGAHADLASYRPASVERCPGAPVSP
jgi:hypothetical protein